jgi:hypothetical protein
VHIEHRRERYLRSASGFCYLRPRLTARSENERSMDLGPLRTRRSGRKRVRIGCHPSYLYPLWRFQLATTFCNWSPRDLKWKFNMNPAMR